MGWCCRDKNGYRDVWESTAQNCTDISYNTNGRSFLVCATRICCQVGKKGALRAYPKVSAKLQGMREISTKFGDMHSSLMSTIHASLVRLLLVFVQHRVGSVVAHRQSAEQPKESRCGSACAQPDTQHRERLIWHMYVCVGRGRVAVMHVLVYYYKQSEP